MLRLVSCFVIYFRVAQWMSDGLNFFSFFFFFHVGNVTYVTFFFYLFEIFHDLLLLLKLFFKMCVSVRMYVILFYFFAFLLKLISTYSLFCSLPTVIYNPGRNAIKIEPNMTIDIATQIIIKIIFCKQRNRQYKLQVSLLFFLGQV